MESGNGLDLGRGESEIQVDDRGGDLVTINSLPITGFPLPLINISTTIIIITWHYHLSSIGFGKWA